MGREENRSGAKSKGEQEKQLRRIPNGNGIKESNEGDMIVEEGILVELSRDSVKGREMTCCVEALRKRTLGIGGIKKRIGQKQGEGNEVEFSEYEKGGELEWSVWKGKKIKKIYTDGSYKEEKTLKTMMLGGHKIKAGGGIAI